MNKQSPAPTTTQSAGLLAIMQAYSWSVYFFCLLLLAVVFSKTFWGEYPFDVSEVLIAMHEFSGGLLSNGIVAGFLFLVSLVPIAIMAALIHSQGKKITSVKLTPANWRVRLFLALLLGGTFLLHLLPTFSCANPMCDYLPVVASFPGLPLGVALATTVDGWASVQGGVWAQLDYRFLTILPNALFLLVLSFYFLTPKAQLPRLIRSRFLLCLGLLALVLGLLVFYLYYLSQIVFTLSDNDLADLLNQHAPAQVVEDFHFQIGDVLIHRPKEIGQDLVTKLSGTNLSHTDTYCGENELINGNGDNFFQTGGINIDKLEWQQRYVRGSLPLTVVLRHPDPQVGAQLCAKLRRAVSDPKITFGVDLLNKRQTFNCSNMVYYYLYPQAPNFNLVTPDLLFVTMLQHDWRLVNWTN